MGRIAMILRRSPYGDISAAEAVRHAMGGVADELGVDLILVDSGVFLAKKGQDDSGTGYMNLEASLKDCIDMGIKVYVDKNSTKENYLEADMIVDGVHVVNSHEIAGIVKESEKTMIF
ncbi:MAG: hypothetical protein OHK0032_14320 [Thermodesulfovibrionales bacterium]